MSLGVLFLSVFRCLQITNLSIFSLNFLGEFLLLRFDNMSILSDPPKILGDVSVFMCTFRVYYADCCKC